MNPKVIERTIEENVMLVKTLTFFANLPRTTSILKVRRMARASILKTYPAALKQAISEQAKGDKLLAERLWYDPTMHEAVVGVCRAHEIMKAAAKEAP